MNERFDKRPCRLQTGGRKGALMTGGAAHNRFVEGQVMADYAAGEGVPRDAIVVEGQAKDTIQNIWYSRAIMQAMAGIQPR